MQCKISEVQHSYSYCMQFFFSEEKCNMICRFRDGSARVINPDERSRTNAGVAVVNTGEKIKDLLHSIENCRIEEEKVNQKKEEQKHFFKQLHLAAFLLSTKYKDSSLFQFKLTTTCPPSGMLSDVLLLLPVDQSEQSYLVT